MSSTPLPERRIGVHMSNPVVRCSLGLQAKLAFPRQKAKSSYAKAEAGGAMRLALVCSITLACVAPVIAQSPQAGPIPMSRQEMRRKGIQALGKPVSPTLEVPPETPVVTLEGVCDRPQVAGAKGCKTVITRAQLDSMIELLAPETPQSARRQFAINYARLLAASEVAQRKHLEKEPAVIKELQAQLKLARMQVLASTLYRQIEEQAANVPASEIQKYYTDHQANFDEGEVLRLTIPKAAATESGQPLDTSAVKATADALRARAAAGEAFGQLQKAAYKELGLKAPPSAAKLNKVRRTRLAPDEAKVFDLKAGEVSEVMEAPAGFVILKLDSKQSIPIETAGSEIKSILRQARLEQEIQSASKNVKAQFNLTYLEMPAAPELFVAPALARPGVVPGTPPNGRSRKWPPRRMPSSSRAQGATLLPQPHN